MWSGSISFIPGYTVYIVYLTYLSMLDQATFLSLKLELENMVMSMLIGNPDSQTKRNLSAACRLPFLFDGIISLTYTVRTPVANES